MRYLWATRGWRWGFRFLRDGGLPDPLPTHLRAFEQIGAAAEGFAVGQGVIALRFLDPGGRKDFAGRPIPHEFVLLEPLDVSVTTLEEGRALVWPHVEAEYAELWAAQPD